MLTMCAQSLSHVQLFWTLWTIACHVPLSIGFSGQRCWSGLPFPTHKCSLWSSNSVVFSLEVFETVFTWSWKEGIVITIACIRTLIFRNNCLTDTCSSDIAGKWQGWNLNWYYLISYQHFPPPIRSAVYIVANYFIF